MTLPNSHTPSSSLTAVTRAKPPGVLEVRSVHRGTGEVQVHQVGLPFVIVGRSSHAGVRLDDPSVSQGHALLQVVDGVPYCVDLGSRTGVVWEDGGRGRGWVPPGHAIRIGAFDVRVTTGGTTGRIGPDPPLLTRAALDIYAPGMPNVRFPLDLPVTTLGSHPRCDIRLLDETAAPFQCALVRTRQDVWCVDILSRNGTPVNGHPSRVAPVRDGDLIELGHVVVALRGNPQEFEPWDAVQHAPKVFIPNALRPHDGDPTAPFRELLEQFRKEFETPSAVLAAVREEHATVLNDIRELLRNVGDRSGAGSDHEAQTREAIALEQRQVREALARLEEEGRRTREELLTRTRELQAELVAARETQARSGELLARAEQELKRQADELRQERLRAAPRGGRGTQPVRTGESPPKRSEPQPPRGRVPAPREAAPSAGLLPRDAGWEAVEATVRPIRVAPPDVPKAPAIPVAAILRLLSSPAAPSGPALAEAAWLLGPVGLVGIVATARGGDAGVRRGAARLCFHLAGQGWQEGRPAEARAAAEHAGRLLQELTQADPEALPLWLESATVHLTLARWLRQHRDTASAIRALVAARDAAQELVAKQPQAVPFRRALAQCLHDLGDCLRATGRPAEGAALLQQAVEQLGATQESSDPAEYAKQLARVQETLNKCLSPEDVTGPAADWPRLLVAAT